MTAYKCTDCGDVCEEANWTEDSKAVCIGCGGEVVTVKRMEPAEAEHYERGKDITGCDI